MGKKSLYFALLFFFTLTPKALTDEKIYQWPSSVSIENISLDSATNIGQLVLDAPAGKHGFVTVKDGHFYFENGTRAKFWGTNLVFNANFPTKKEARMLADRLAFFGFNAVRLHHMDYYFEPRGIFEDIAPAYKNPQAKKTGYLSKKQLDKLDYLIYLLKKRGIYVNINLLVSRRFTEADGLLEADKLGIAAKPVSMFDPQLIALQKKYAHDLLTHKNKYTGLKYNDEPAIALIEITNENSIIHSWKQNRLNKQTEPISPNTIPDYYIKQLDLYWNNWLQKKYGTLDHLKKSWQTDPQLSAAAQKSTKISTHWRVEQHASAKINVNTQNNTTTLNIKNITATPWHLQYRTTPIPLSKGQKYLLTFTAFADKNMNISVVAQQAVAPWKNLGLSRSISLTKTPQTYTIPFVPSMNSSRAKIGFILGYTKGNITFQDIAFQQTETFAFIQKYINTNGFHFSRPLYKDLALYPPEIQKDIQQFYIDLERKYFQEMRDFLRKECSIKVPITGIGGFAQPESLQAQKDMDFIDIHTYWDHPRFPNKPWDKNDFIMHNKSLLADKNLGIIGNIIKRHAQVQSLFNKPFTISEWNHCYPNKYAYETPTLIAAKALEHDWDALFQFAFSHGWRVKPDLKKIQNYFDIIANPRQLILMSLGSLIYLKHEKNDVQIKFINNDTYELKTPYLQGTVGQHQAHFSGTLIKNIKIMMKE